MAAVGPVTLGRGAARAAAAPRPARSRSAEVALRPRLRGDARRAARRARSASCSSSASPSACSRSAAARIRCCSTPCAGRSAAPLAVEDDRVAGERVRLRLAVGAATERCWLSYPRLDVGQGRARVPSFYALDVVRASTGAVPDHVRFEHDTAIATGAWLAWPAPDDPGVGHRRLGARPGGARPAAAAVRRAAGERRGPLPAGAEPRAGAVAAHAVGALEEDVVGRGTAWSATTPRCRRCWPRNA